MDYKFKINEFEGPLDLLLHLIKESKMDIMDIEIVTLTNQYLEYIEKMQDINLNIASEYLVLAAELMYLKSRYLLPNKNQDEEDEEYNEAKENLVNRLLEYKRYKELSNEFRHLEDERHLMYTKTPSNLKDYKGENIMLSTDISLNDLMDAFKKFLLRKQKESPLTTKVTNKEISQEERTLSIRKMLKQKSRFEFFELFEDFSRPYVVVTFLSILEMAKKHELTITQENNFDKIYVNAVGGSYE